MDSLFRGMEQFFFRELDWTEVTVLGAYLILMAGVAALIYLLSRNTYWRPSPSAGSPESDAVRERAPRRKSPERRAVSGSSILETTLVLPFYVFLFIGAFDWGVYAHALISAESALRIATLYASNNSTTAIDSTKVCSYVLGELQAENNIGSLAACAGLPVIVNTELITGPDGRPAVRVTLTYRTAKLVPIPGVLMDQLTIHRALEMRLRS